MDSIYKQILLLIIFPVFAFGQNLLPPIHNYKIFEYKASGKNWGLSANEDGELYSANNMGLLQYNGEEWKLNKLPNKTIIRSVAQIGGKIYTGSYEEFGCWEKNEFGQLDYTSLTHLIKGHTFTSEEFWQILPFGQAILFRSFSKIYKYQNGQIQVLDPHMIVSNMSIYNGKLLVAGDKGLFYMTENKLTPLQGMDLLADKIVIDMAPIREGLLIGTKLHGCFVLKNDRLEPWSGSVNPSLKLYQLNRILALANGKIAFGTIKNGIYLFDPTENSLINLNREAGLQNNTVLTLFQFQNQLWVGLDNGIDRIQLNAPITYYTDFSGVLGTVYDMAVNNGVLYLGSNTGIYYFLDNKLKFVEGSQGHVWDTEIVDGELFFGHNTGTFIVKNGALVKVSNFSGGYEIINVPEQKSTYIQGTYNGLAKFIRTANGDWQVIRVSGLEFPVKQICFENPTTLWAAHPYKGFYQLKINGEYDKILEINELKADIIPSNYNIKIYNIKNQILFNSEGEWFKYDPILGKITAFEQFKPYRHKDLIYNDDEHFWFMDNDSTKEIIYTDLKKDNLLIAGNQLKERVVPEAEHVVKINDSIYLFTLSDGFGQINISKLKRQVDNFTAPVPELTSFKVGKEQYAINGPAVEIPYKISHDLFIDFASPSLTRPRFYYELNGARTQTLYKDNGSLNFQNLPYGDYTLKVSSVGIDNKKSPPKIVAFEILPPWYLSRISWFGYFMALLMVIFLIRAYNRRKLERKHDILKERYIRERSKHLELLEKEKLEKEVKMKQKELANITLNIAKKNEVILDVKNMLLVNKDKFSNQQRYRSFIKKLDNSINDLEDWKRFEVNFKELHDDFFERLLTNFPELTPKDLKLAAYLKMNLSSKDIAPLMAITTRGVEIHRYRLRKKLKLDSSENISNFLIRFK